MIYHIRLDFLGQIQLIIKHFSHIHQFHHDKFQAGCVNYALSAGGFLQQLQIHFLAKNASKGFPAGHSYYEPDREYQDCIFL